MHLFHTCRCFIYSEADASKKCEHYHAYIVELITTCAGLQMPQECFGFTMHLQTNDATLQSKSNDFKSLRFGAHVLSRTCTSILV